MPSPPRSPTQLTAETVGDAAIDLAWIDDSSDETFFDLERAAGGAAFETAVRVKPDVSAFEDARIHPGWPYVYRVRALSLQGPSPWSNTAGAALPATLDVDVVSGSMTDSPRSKRDTLKLVATYAMSSGATFDPAADGLDLQLGAANAPVLVSIAPLDAAWKVRKKKGAPLTATWKSPKHSFPAVTIVVDFKRRRLTATVSAADFTAEPTADVRTLVASGAQGGRHDAAWVERRPGVWRSK
jgi:hypothetical protein